MAASGTKRVGWLLLCRPGFESECAAEAVERVRAASCGVAPRVQRGPGWVRVEFADVGSAELDAACFRDLTFARQGCWLLEGGAGFSSAPVRELPDVVSRWLDRLPAVAEVLVEAPDGDVGRPLWPLCRSIQGRLSVPHGGPGRRAEPLRLHLVLTGLEAHEVGVAPVWASSPLPGGIPRLRHASEAPSRSALKLEEALLFFLDDAARALRLRPGMRAVDLGAAPGGWSWVLARRGLWVTAVDNGPLDRAALDTGLVEPLRADGFVYRPEKPVDWLVCDMVAPPARVAKLVGIWGRQGLCGQAVFNLKLPGGDRLAELRRCEATLRREIGRCTLRFKQLYHDREEVTGYLVVEPRPGAQRGKRAGAKPGPKGQGLRARDKTSSGGNAGGGRRGGRAARRRR